MGIHYQDIHGFIICKSYHIFSDFMSRHNLDPASYMHLSLSDHSKVCGFHLSSHPNTIVILLDAETQQRAGNLDLTPASRSRPMFEFLRTFNSAGLVITKTQSDLIKILTYVLRIPSIAVLPKYLTHDEDLIREFAARRFGELTGNIKMKGNKLTNCNLRLKDN